ncbi:MULTISPECIES: hypothetical protein [Helicobacter]|uniref:hypothetical protein n=1 Tax=Helicobacter TaxID=209 RepID=UPI0026380C0C|nr:hypothetical protein [Helicobacter sp. UBA3407]
MRVFTEIEIAKIQQAISEKKEKFPQEWLGRTLAYTPYQPRPLPEIFKKPVDSIPKILYDFSLQTLDTSATQISLLQTAKDYESRACGFFVESLEILTYIRRYVSIPLIYDFLILDSYQLLESLVYGADSVVLLPKFLTQKQLKNLSDYATKIGLSIIFRIESKEDLTKAIFSKADILDLNENFSLLSMIPKNKIILSKIPKNFQESHQNYFKALDITILEL